MQLRRGFEPQLRAITHISVHHPSIPSTVRSGGGSPWAKKFSETHGEREDKEVHEKESEKTDTQQMTYSQRIYKRPLGDESAAGQLSGSAADDYVGFLKEIMDNCSPTEHG